jgi:phenylacetate-CoA ligase
LDCIEGVPDHAIEMPTDAATPYEATRRRQIADMLARVPGHLERLAWPPERLREERVARLRTLLATATHRSSWHRERLGDVDPTAVDEDVLSTLPVMSKDDLMTHFDAIVTDPRVTLERVNAHIGALDTDAYFLGDLHAVASGGSSGVRAAFVWGWDAWAEVQLALLRRQISDRLADPKLATTPPISMFVGAQRAAHFTSALAQTFATDAIQVHRFPVTLPIDGIVAGLNEVRGDGLATYPSMLATLVAEARAGRLRIAPCRIVTMAEPLFPEIRAAAEATWNAPIANLWGTSEAGITAMGCFRGSGMHVSDDQVIIEPVDADGRPVPPGVRSAKIYVTNLINPLLPLIRYEITDEVTVLDEPCACGSAFTRVADIQGRNDDVFVYATGIAIHPHVFRSRLAQEATVSEYQVRQTLNGADVLLRTSGAVDLDRLVHDLASALTEVGCEHPTVTARRVDHLARLETGKLKRFLPNPTT